MKPKYRAALFDLDDTLFDHQSHRRDALAEVARHIPALSRVDVRALEAAHDVHLQRTHGAVLSGTLSIPEARTQRMRGFLGDYGVNADAALADACEKIYREAYDCDWRTVPGALELLQALRERGLWIGVITNGLYSEQAAKVRRLGLESVLNDLIVSEAVGSKKPAREFFDHAVARTGFRRSECVVIGDLWEIDIEGAVNYDMSAIWLNRYERAFETYPGVVEVKSLLPTEAMLRLFLDEEGERHGQPIEEPAAHRRKQNALDTRSASVAEGSLTCGTPGISPRWRRPRTPSDHED